MPKGQSESVAKIESQYIKQYDAQVERQKRKKKRLHRRLILFSILMMVILASLTAYHMKQRALYAEKKDQYEQLDEKMTTLNKEEESLKEEIQLLNDEEYVTEVARNNYFLSKKGEVIFKLPEENSSY